MSYIIAGWIFLYLAAWTIQVVIRLCYWTCTPLYNWAEQIASKSRYPNTRTSWGKLIFTWPVASGFRFYKWLNRHVRDLLGHYLIFASLLLLLIFIVIDIENRGIVSYIVLFLLTIALIPTFFSSTIVEPLGLVRLSHLLGQFSRFTYRRNSNGGPLFSAVLAWKHVRNKEKEDAHRRRLEGLLAQWYSKELGVIICRLLLASENTEEEKIIGMLQAFYFTDSFKCPRRIKKHAGLWLVALEAKRGNWQSVRKWSALWLKEAPSTDLLFFYLVSRKMEDEPVPGGGVILFCSWISTFNCKYILMLKLAFQRKPEAMRRQLALLDEDSPDRETGLQLLLHFAESPQLRQNKELLNTLARNFESILAAEQYKAADNAGKLQGIGQAEKTLSQIFSSWNESAHGTLPSQDCSFLFNGMNGAREDTGLLEALDYNLEALRNRYLADRFVNTEFEWQEWATVMVLYEQIVLYDGMHFQAYQAVLSICWNWAVWLWNEQHEFALSSGVFRWIRHEAISLGDYDTAEAMDGNLC